MINYFASSSGHQGKNMHASTCFNHRAIKPRKDFHKRLKSFRTKKSTLNSHLIVQVLLN